ncbi:MobA/MobL family protein [Sphingomonas morindae]|uniref:MobA/MobL family protein n=1 Tax=Sphingomonas morindae TaxID=1541170 RepID=A0ABY4XBY0_9SPHN|nr:MobA/MobL family protein [Sphingomonas morindae]USI74477.1 MobA/MobL family protein [Sphingomonas morindae]
MRARASALIPCAAFFGLPRLESINMIDTLPLHFRRPVSIRPISVRGWRAMSGDRRGTHRSATANYLYITRSAGTDAWGPVDYRHRTDLVAHGLALPSNHPAWAEEEGRVWRELDEATQQLGDDQIRAWHVVVTLPAESSTAEWTTMVRGYAAAVARHGQAVAWAIHASPEGEAAAPPPHAHLLLTTRQWRHTASHGRTVANWCGPAMTEQLHSQWLSRLPADMQAAATSPYRVGSFAPAHPDCSALAALFGSQPTNRSRRPAQRTLRRPSQRIRKERKCPSE